MYPPWSTDTATNMQSFYSAFLTVNIKFKLYIYCQRHFLYALIRTHIKSLS